MKQSLRGTSAKEVPLSRRQKGETATIDELKTVTQTRAILTEIENPETTNPKRTWITNVVYPTLIGIFILGVITADYLFSGNSPFFANSIHNFQVIEDTGSPSKLSFRFDYVVDPNYFPDGAEIFIDISGLNSYYSTFAVH